MSMEAIIIPLLYDAIVLSGILDELAPKVKDVALSLRKNEAGAYDIVACSQKQLGKAQIQKVRADIEGQVKQRYAYEKVKQELAKKGFILATEEVQPDKTIRLVARKW